MLTSDEPQRAESSDTRREPTPEALAALQDRLGVRLPDTALLLEALTHRSWAQEGKEPTSYERLEFLGDAVLGVLTAEWLYARESAGEGELSKLKSHLVSEPVLAAHANRLGLGALLRVGLGEERSGGRAKPSLLADALEAVIAAVYLGAGLAAARGVVLPLLEQARAVMAQSAAPGDAKTALQEVLQGRGGEPPEYRLVGTSGPDHQKQFRVECWAAGVCLGSGEGSSKKRAEQAAAAAALATLGG